MEKNDLIKYYAPIWIQGILLILNSAVTFSVLFYIVYLISNTSPDFYRELLKSSTRGNTNILGELIGMTLFITALTIIISLTHFEIKKLENYMNREQPQQNNKKLEL